MIILCILVGLTVHPHDYLSIWSVCDNGVLMFSLDIAKVMICFIVLLD